MRNNNLHNILLERKGSVYSFNEQDKIFAKKLASKKAKEAFNVRNRVPSYNKPFERLFDNFYVGSIGEIATHRIFIDLNLSFFISKNCGDEGVDFKYEETVIDVKTSKYIFSNSNNKMICIPRFYDKTDVYFVVSLEQNMNEAVFMGHLWKEDAIKNRSIREIKNGQIIGVDKRFLY